MHDIHILPIGFDLGLEKKHEPTDALDVSLEIKYFVIILQTRESKLFQLITV